MYPQIILSPIFTPFLYNYKNIHKPEEVADKIDDKRVSTTKTRSETVVAESMISDSNASHGYHVWKMGSFINFLYLVAIPGCVPYTSSMFGITVVHDHIFPWLLMFLPIIIGLLIIGALYFFGNICRKSIAEFNPDVFDPILKEIVHNEP